MSLNFPNPSRSYDPDRHRIRFWGHDSAMEASFFVTEDALKQIQPAARFDEDSLLGAFDANRDLIYATAAKRCGGNYDAERAAFIRDLANGDCTTVNIRSYSELSKCLPTFQSISCTNLTEQRFDPSCAELIVRSK